ncbi:MAG: hypothetical protein E7233_05285 [Lachnospiraceae bacterium]|nr:hypothetical protein [Lachnospiraceae bacterium]
MVGDLNVGKAAMLLAKLINDTMDNKLCWEKKSTLGSDDRMNYYFKTDIDETFSAFIQNLNGTVFVWVENMGERIYINEKIREDQSIMTLMNKLHGIVKYFSDLQVMKKIDKYLEIAVDEKEYEINEADIEL